jgi:hypothetical protein
MVASGGCMSLGQPSIRNAAAGAMSYSRVVSTADRQRPQLAQALKSLNNSQEHRKMQDLLRRLPVAMHKCLLIESAAISPLMSGKPVILTGSRGPLLLAVFETDDGLGFLANYPVTADESDSADATADGSEAPPAVTPPFTTRGWRAGVWEVADKGGPPFPDDPARLLPGLQFDDSTQAPSKRTGAAAPADAQDLLVVITLVDRRAIATAAAIVSADAQLSPEQQVMYGAGRSLRARSFGPLPPPSRASQAVVTKRLMFSH